MLKRCVVSIGIPSPHFHRKFEVTNAPIASIYLMYGASAVQGHSATRNQLHEKTKHTQTCASHERLPSNSLQTQQSQVQSTEGTQCDRPRCTHLLGTPGSPTAPTSRLLLNAQHQSLLFLNLFHLDGTSPYFCLVTTQAGIYKRKLTGSNPRNRSMYLEAQHYFFSLLGNETPPTLSLHFYTFNGF